MISPIMYGLLIGFVSAIPLAGPISALVFSYGMQRRSVEGRWLAAGAGLVEAGYCFLAFISFNRFLKDLTYLYKVSNLATAFLLAGIGIYFYRSKKMRVREARDILLPVKEHQAFFLGAGIAITNFTLLATWTTLATTLFSLGLFDFTQTSILFFSSGVALGIFCWFILMLRLITNYRHRFDLAVQDKILKGVGLLLCGLAVAILMR